MSHLIHFPEPPLSPPEPERPCRCMLPMLIRDLADVIDAYMEAHGVDTDGLPFSAVREAATGLLHEARWEECEECRR